MAVSTNHRRMVRVPATAHAAIRASIPAETEIETSPLTSFSAFGDAPFTITNAEPVGQSEDGSYFVVTENGGSITAMGTASSQDGTTGYWKNGAEVDPFWMGAEPGDADAQGMDELIANLQTHKMPYSHAKNIDPAVAGPMAYAAGDEFTIFKAKHNDAATIASHDCNEFYAVHFVKEAPPAGSFAPPISTTGAGSKAPLVRIQDFTRAGYQRLDLTGLGFPDPATILSKWPAGLIPWTGITGDPMRAANVLSVFEGTNYSAYVAEELSHTYALLHSDISDAEWMALAREVVRQGINVFGMYQRGFTGKAAAGQNHIYACMLWHAGCITGNLTLYDTAAQMLSNMGDQMLYAPASEEGVATPWPDTNGRRKQTLLSSLIGRGEWRMGGAHFPDDPDTAITARYRYTSSGGRFSELPTALLCKAHGALPDGYTQFLTGGGALTQTHRPAALEYLDREPTFEPTERRITAPAIALFAAHRDKMGGWPVWTGVPEQFCRDGNPGRTNPVWIVGPGDGQFGWDFSAILAGNHYSTLPLTGLDVAYGLDEIQMVEQIDASWSDTVDGPAGRDVWCKVRLKNATGHAEWSPLFIHDEDVSLVPRGRLTTTGTPSGVTSNLVQPRLYVKRYPLNEIPLYDDVSGTTLDDAVTKVFCGLGWWENPQGAFGFQWYRNTGTWEAISGAITQDYDIATDDYGRPLRCDLSNNGVVVSSVEVTVPAPAIAVAQSAAYSSLDLVTSSWVLPAGITDGSLMVVIVENDDDTCAVVAPPAGWTLAASVTVQNGRAKVFRVWTKVAAADSGAAFDIEWSFGTEVTAHFIEVPGGSGVSIAGANATLDPPAITPDGGAIPRVFVALATVSRSYGDFTVYPTGYSPLQNTQVGGGSSVQNHRMVSAYRIVSVASEDPAAFEHSTTTTTYFEGAVTLAIA